MRTRFVSALVFFTIAALLLGGSQAFAAQTTPSQATRPVWEISRVEDVPYIANQLGDHAAVYASDGVLHAAFGGDHLYYARCEGSNCAVQVVDPADFVGQQASLALDSHGYPHIAYFAIGPEDYCNDEQIKYARWDGAAWHIQVVIEDCVGAQPSLALDADDVPHISFFHESFDSLQLADWDGAFWNTYTPAWLPGFDYSGVYSSLQSDSAGDLHLAFIGGDISYGKVWYTQKTGDDWSPLVDVSGETGVVNLSMALDSAGKPHLAYNRHYYDNTLSQYLDKLTYAHFDGAAWQTPEEIADMQYLAPLAITTGPDGYPRLAYLDASGLAYLAKSPSGWGAPVPIPDVGNSEYLYLGWLSPTRLGVTLFAGGAVQQIYADPPYHAWSAPSEIFASRWVGAHNAVVSDAVGNLHAAYTDQTERELHYASRAPGEPWQFQTVRTYAEDYLFIRALDIDLSGQGHPQIVFELYDQHTQRSKIIFMAWTGQFWIQMPTGPSQDLEGCSPSLELDAYGIIYIAYNRCDFIHDNLWLAIYENNWTYQEIDPEAGTTAPSLYVQDPDHIHVSYSRYEYPEGDLRYAYQEGSPSWDIQDVAPVTYTPTGTSLALDSAGKPHIAYVSQTGIYGDFIVNLASWDGLFWQVEPVSMTDTDFVSPRLALDTQDRPHIAFTSERHPAYAVRDGGEWAFTIPVDSPPIHPEMIPSSTHHLSLALAADKPVLVYNAEGDLKAARLSLEFLSFLPITIR